MANRLRIGSIEVEVVFKNIKNVHLSVNPPSGHVRIAAPTRMKLDTVRVFAISKLEWIKRQQKRFQRQERETAREFLSGESHYLWGKRYLLKVVEGDAPPNVMLRHRHILLNVRKGSSSAKRQAVLDAWYRSLLKHAAQELLIKWQRILRVKPNQLFVQKMKTKWGSCNTNSRNIRLNVDLAKKPAECLEYIVIHELLHLIERRHNDRFTTLMERHMPNWQSVRRTLNEGPLAQADWAY
ncbi:M48 family metallopeptidase [Methylocystis sp. MJC1]|uniref:M48 family metallopeptidase n=1 Tax=Methylocystis sp. MJC1 TaxID=2654282 RepID=UPI0013EA556D|nr:SprT family zinc-dependent metalloprotease [Methylocystis sp. MJC1]KAF2989424.1 hypothetical protein MJC1_03398 [Methylocystis sp. MJC1]MBU6527984.1 M48 family metallopeptidase [Methylocystis sp. MJC1]UZX10904.1 M48 family metallopeptidase [Methylocystis sp. MJC1]